MTMKDRQSVMPHSLSFLASNNWNVRLIERVGERDEPDAGIGVKRGQQLNRGPAITLSREGITDFEKHSVGRDEANTLGLNESGDLDGLAMELIRGRRKSDRKRGVEEHFTQSLFQKP